MLVTTLPNNQYFLLREVLEKKRQMNIAAEFAVDFDEDTQAMAIDHINFASDGFIQSNVIIGTSRSVYAANSLVLKMLSASPSAYYANWVSHHSSFSFAECPDQVRGKPGTQIGDEQFVTELSKWVSTKAASKDEAQTVAC
ncbi:Dolichyl-diphosphooligosaccharide--protein glycosyltransferase 48 kDa subunit [Citrus sinensis]|uniref:Dolichyl-diphosphooligosaccharide--protein glycosyltransferase 48 kDa subunit n=1 Tax=Citrus sinensis TaxID=2711 RepID=A0ACB8J2P8_CITSI|nr:Dolichyl-diphosphooligosaccharide--protein glycosyltransferase 48 kDa subunit [Citrus sinensis]